MSDAGSGSGPGLHLCLHRTHPEELRLQNRVLQVRTRSSSEAAHPVGVGITNLTTSCRLSSPHLVQVRERIRINGRPISKDLFTKYFWQVYGRLDRSKEAHGGTMPAYFRFLTILAFHVFLQEKVRPQRPEVLRPGPSRSGL